MNEVIINYFKWFFF